MRTGAGQVEKNHEKYSKKYLYGIYIHTVSKFIDLFQFHFICQVLAKFSRVESDRILSKFRKRKRDVTLLLYSPLRKG